MKDDRADHSQSSDKNQTNDDDSQERSPGADQITLDQGEAVVAIKPVKKKLGEGRDNLRQREKWFQRRSGKDK